MNSRMTTTLIAASCGAVAIALLTRTSGPSLNSNSANAATLSVDADTQNRSADIEAIRQTAKEFEQAIEKGDAKAVAAQWTSNAIYYGEGGQFIQGRSNIEKAFVDHFKGAPKAKMSVEVAAIHFPSQDTAIEDGILRTNHAGPTLPTSTFYSTLHVREDGKWKIAVSREWGAADSKLHDLEWLIGKWTAGEKDVAISMDFEWNPTRSLIRNRFQVKVGDKTTASGVQMIGMDPSTGRIRSWMFDDDGSRGESIWNREANSWVLETVGSSAEGSKTASVNIINRLNENEFVWRSIHRMFGGDSAPDTVPVKVTRVSATR